MAHFTAASALPPEFDDFLFAPIGEDGNGMLLSVISAFARLDLDPWQEAANLARLPGAAAARRLASLIATLPGLPLVHWDLATVAARLITRLPHLTGSPASSVKPLHGPGVGARTMIRAYPASWVWAILAIVALGGLSIGASQLTAGRVGSGSAPATGTDTPRVSSPNAGR